MSEHEQTTPPSDDDKIREQPIDQAVDSQNSPDIETETRSFEEPASAIGEQIGPYRILEAIGEGGMGSVYRAEQREPVRRRVALKIIKAGMDTGQVIARFEAERQALAMMDHPNIAKVFEAGTTESGRPYFVMELVEGQPITKFCDVHKLGIDQRLEIFRQVCNAVQHAHQKGIIHRDLKPSNVLVTMQDDTPVPKVIDFGLAKATGQQLTEKTMFTAQGQVLGTLEYMSPEQANLNDLDIDTRSDIYSLGVILYELLTGSTPLTRESLKRGAFVEILNRIKEEEPERPSSRISHSSDSLESISSIRQIEPRQLSSLMKGELDWVVMKALEKNRIRRYESANDFADDIRRYLNGDVVVARPASTGYKFNKFVKKNRGLVAALTAIAVTMVAGMAGTGIGWYRSQAALKTANDQTILAKKQFEALAEARQVELSLREKQIENQVETFIKLGQWQDAKLAIGQLKTDQGARLPQRFQLANLAVLDGLQNTQELKAALREIETENWDPELVGQKDLWLGYGNLLDGNAKVDPAVRIRSALESGTLGEADTYFARGLVADSLEESVELYQQAIESSSFHLRARLQLVITHILMGRREDGTRATAMAINFFPDDVRFYHAQALNFAFGADRPATLKSLDVATTKFPQVETGYILSALNLAEEFQAALSSIESASPLTWIKMAARLQAASLSQSSVILVQEFHKPQVFKAFLHYVRAITSPAYLFAGKQKKLELMRKACQESYEIHPDALFLQIEGIHLYSMGRFEEAEPVFCKAMDGFSLFPAVTREAIFFAYACRAGIFAKSKDDADLQKAADYLVKYPMSSVTSTSRFDLAFGGLARARRWEKAKELLAVQIQRTGERRSWLKLLARRAEGYDEYGIALLAWDELVRAFPDDSELSESRTALIEKMAAQVNEASDSKEE